MDEPGPASEWLSDARDAYDAQGRAAEVATMDRMMGGVLLDLGHRIAAYARVELAAKEHETLRDPASLADDLEFLAALAVEANALDRARALARRAVDARRDADDPPGEIEARVLLARCQSLSDDWAGASATLAPAVELVRRDGVPSEQVRLLILAADVDRRPAAPTAPTPCSTRPARSPSPTTTAPSRPSSPTPADVPAESPPIGPVSGWGVAHRPGIPPGGPPVPAGAVSRYP